MSNNAANFHTVSTTYFPYSESIDTPSQPYHTQYQVEDKPFANIRTLMEQSEPTVSTVTEKKPIVEAEETPLINREISQTPTIPLYQAAILSLNKILNTTSFLRNTSLLAYTFFCAAAIIYTGRLTTFIEDNNTYVDPLCHGHNEVSHVTDVDKYDNIHFSCENQIDTQANLGVLFIVVYYMALSLLGISHAANELKLASQKAYGCFSLGLLFHAIAVTCTATTWLIYGPFQLINLNQYMNDETCNAQCRDFYNYSVYYSEASMVIYPVYLITTVLNLLVNTYLSEENDQFGLSLQKILKHP